MDILTLEESFHGWMAPKLSRIFLELSDGEEAAGIVFDLDTEDGHWGWVAPC
jgi:hypothetical protein